MAVSLENMQISRVIIHEINKAPGSSIFDPPHCNSTLLILGATGLVVLRDRLTAVLGKDSQCIEMEVEDSGEGSVFQDCTSLVSCDDDEFVRLTQSLTKRLVQVQTHPRIPGGIVLVASGTVGQTNKPFAVMIKADMHDGFSVSARESNLGLELIERLALTPQQKFYKAAIFIEITPNEDDELKLPENYEIYVFDNNLAQSPTGGLARYFYGNFLGCKFASTAKKQTRDFYKLTSQYIDSLSSHDEEKTDLHTGLYSYLRSQSNVIHAQTFAETFMSDNFRVAYYEFLSNEGFPDSAVQKDIQLIDRKLKMRKIRFDNKVTIAVPSIGFDNFFEIVEVGESSTTIRINGRIVVQE